MKSISLKILTKCFRYIMRIIENMLLHLGFFLSFISTYHNKKIKIKGSHYTIE